MLEHLSYLSEPIENYINRHMNAHEDIGRSNANEPAYNFHQLMKENKHLEFKGIHPSCATKDDSDEVLSCVMFGKKDATERFEYRHVLYLGINTDNPQRLERDILDELDIDIDDFKKSSSLWAMCHR